MDYFSITLLLCCLSVGAVGHAQDDFKLEWANGGVMCGLDNVAYVYQSIHSNVSIDSIRAGYAEFPTIDSLTYQLGGTFQPLDFTRKQDAYLLSRNSELAELRGQATLRFEIFTADRVVATLYEVCSPLQFEVVLGGRFIDPFSVDTVAYSELSTRGGLTARVTCCGFEARCVVDSYRIYSGSRDTTVTIKGIQAYRRFIDSTTYREIRGSLLVFHDIQVGCPGTRKLLPAENIIVYVK